MFERERSVKSGLIYMVSLVFFGLPALVGYGAVPLPNLTAEALCPLGLALMLTIIGLQVKQSGCVSIEMRAGMAAFGVLAFVMCIQFFVLQQRQLDAYLVVLGYFFCAGVAIWLGYQAAAGGHSGHWFQAAAISLVIAATLAALASMAQYFEIDARVVLVSPASEAGRTYGFFRQPNQQGTFLNMGSAALLFLYKTGRLKLWIWAALNLLLIFGVVTTGSRTALVQIAFMSVGSLALSASNQKSRIKTLLPLLAVAIIWVLLYLASNAGGAHFFGAQKLDQVLTEGAGIRKVAWSQTLVMLSEQPWSGYGILRYPPVFLLHDSGIQVSLNISHSHNLFLQLAVDFGLPVACLFSFMMGWVIWRTRANWSTNSGSMAAMILGCLFIHSLVEFPLWYTYFLLPACWFLGWLSCRKSTPFQDVYGMSLRTPYRSGQLLRRAACILGGALLASTVLSMNRDYFYLTPAFSPGLASTLAQRVEDTRKVFWFSRYSELAQLQMQPLSVANAASHAKRAAVVGCVMSDIWLQTGTLLTMAQAGYVNDAKWILYIISKTTKSDMSYYRNTFIGSTLPAAAELITYIDNPKAVTRSLQLFEQTCSAK
jgi:O-antigen ligase